MRRLAALLVVVLGGTGVAACDDTGRGRTDSTGGTGELAGMPGVRDTWSGLREVEDGVRGLVVEADLDEDITPRQLTAVLDALAQAEPDLYTLSLGWGELPRSVPDDLGDRDLVDGAYSPLDPPTSDRAEQFLASARTYDGSVTLSSGGTEVVLDDGGPDDLTTALEATLADPVLRRTPHLGVRTGEHQPGDASAVRSDEPMTPVTLDRWRRLRATLASAPADSAPWIRLREGRDHDDEPPVRVSVGIVLPGVTQPGTVTPETWGDRLWPMIRPQLDVVGQLPPGSTYQLALDLNPGGLPKDETIVALTVGRGAGDRPSAWDAAATTYLTGVTSP